MTRHDRPRGVGGERFSTEPVGAVLRIGKKGDRGNPVDRDRFYVASPHEADGVRPLHPSFEGYNTALPEKRRMVRANLVHGNLRDAFDLGRYAFRLPGYEPPPNKRPGCEGDGKVAVRYLDGDFRNIPCPGDLCEFAQAGACKIRLTVLFRPNWQSDRLPAPLMRYASRGEHMLSSIYGLFDLVAEVAHNVGLIDEKPYETEGYRALEEAGVPMFGLPFSMTLTERTNKEKRARFPVVIFAPDGDLVAWMIGILQQREQLGGAREVFLLGAPPPATVADDTDDVIDVDVRELEPEAREAGPVAPAVAVSVAPAPPAPPQPQPAPIGDEAKKRILDAASAKGLDIDGLEDLIERSVSELMADDERLVLDRLELLPAKGKK
jgi:hypothetical protein